jgi:hypothetical protein
MDNSSANSPSNQVVESPSPEVLKPREDDGTPLTDQVPADLTKQEAIDQKPLRRRTYRPSHKATFISLVVVAFILAVNAVIIGFVLQNKIKTNNQATAGQVTVSSAALNKIGINNSTIGNSGVKLVVDPNAQFNSNITVAGNTNIAGQLNLNGKFTADNTNITQLQAGNTSLSQLEVNGSTTLTTLSLRNNLAVAGTSQLQGTVTIGQLLTVNNNIEVSGNLSVGGVLTTNSFSANSLTSSSALTVDGHIITGGAAPTIGPGNALGSNGTTSINGNDTSGTISINIGINASAGTLASLAFHRQYSSIPHVIITPVGNSINPSNIAADFYVYNVTINGFSIGVAGVANPTVNGGLPNGGYAIDYMVEQ